MAMTPFQDGRQHDVLTLVFRRDSKLPPRCSGDAREMLGRCSGDAREMLGSIWSRLSGVEELIYFEEVEGEGEGEWGGWGEEMMD